MGLRKTEQLNALTNPLHFGDQVELEGQVLEVGQKIDGTWYLSDAAGNERCHGHGMVNFIGAIVYASESSARA